MARSPEHAAIGVGDVSPVPLQGVPFHMLARAPCLHGAVDEWSQCVAGSHPARCADSQVTSRPVACLWCGACLAEVPGHPHILNGPVLPWCPMQGPAREPPVPAPVHLGHAWLSVTVTASE